jgi:hypothetical protein
MWAPASDCYKTALAHLEQNQLSDALSCLDEAFLALAKDQSREVDVKAQTTICAHYKVAVALLQVFAICEEISTGTFACLWCWNYLILKLELYIPLAQ